MFDMTGRLLRPASADLVIARSESDEAIHFSSCGAMDCFAEPVIGPRFARTRWLAMTKKNRRRNIGCE